MLSTCVTWISVLSVFPVDATGGNQLRSRGEGDPLRVRKHDRRLRNDQREFATFDPLAHVYVHHRQTPPSTARIFGFREHCVPVLIAETFSLETTLFPTRSD